MSEFDAFSRSPPMMIAQERLRLTVHATKAVLPQTAPLLIVSALTHA
jgi:hypothetical protein